MDGSDPWHQQARAKAQQHISSNVPSQHGPCLYRDFGQLRYTLRSLMRYAPWLATIYIVANTPPPYWLEEEQGRLIWVRHEEIFPEDKDLPTFSSRAIECHLHRIPGLSRHFLYFNDDFSLLAPTDIEDFFSSEGPIFYLNTAVCIKDFAPHPQDVYGTPIRHADDLLDAKFSIKRRAPLAHTPYPIDKELFSKVQEAFPEEIRITSSCPFRTLAGIDPLYLYAHYALERQQASWLPCEDKIYFPFSNDRAFNLRVYSKILEDAASGQHKFLCLNDAIEDDFLSVGVAEDLEAFYQKLYPAPSHFEKFHTVTR